VHRPGERERRQLDGRALGQPRQLGRAENAHYGPRVVGQEVALDRGQRCVQQHRDEPDTGRPEHRADQVGRRPEREGHPIPPAAAPCEQGPGRTALAVLGVGGAQQLDGGGVPGH